MDGGGLGVVYAGYLRRLKPVVQLLAVGYARARALALSSRDTPQDEMATVTRQIELDLPRTFPEHLAFAAEPGRAALRRILHAHARRNSEIGYTQSLNFIAAFLFLQCPANGVCASAQAS